MKCAPFQSPSKRNPMREFCGENRNSLFFPPKTLLKGMLPKFDPKLDPAFLSRQKVVRSMNPTGTRQVLPRRMNAGAGPSGTASHGFLAAPAAFCWALNVEAAL